MNKAEKIRFINDLVGRVAAEVIHSVETGAVPDDWNGRELRHLLAGKFKEATQVGTPYTKAQLRDINNTILVNNL